MRIGYMFCSHTNCLATIIGAPGDLCEDCQACNPDKDASFCDGCDHD